MLPSMRESLIVWSVLIGMMALPFVVTFAYVLFALSLD